MVDKFDLMDALGCGPQDRHRVGGFIRRFVAAWHGAPTAGTNGWGRSQVAAAVHALTARYPAVTALPAALVDTYVLVGHRRDVTSNQDYLLDPAELSLDDTGQVLVVRRENQGCARWGIRVDDLYHDDPPVIMQVAGLGRGWRPYADRWSLASVEMVLFESLWTPADLSTDLELDEHTVKVVEQRFAPLPLPALPHWTLPSVRWFVGPDLLLREEAQTWLWVRARTRHALDTARRTLSR